MLCISIREPFVTAIFMLGKNVENRTWRTNFRGQLGIHVSRNVETSELRGLGLRTNDLFPLGCIVGTVELYNITRSSRSRWARDDQFHWLIRNPVRIEPVRLRGRLGLFRTKSPF